MAKGATRKDYGFGGCKVAGISPPARSWTSKTETIKVRVDFGEALRLQLALEDALLAMNRYKRGADQQAELVLRTDGGQNRLHVARRR